MRSSFAVHTGLRLAMTPNYRRQASRRRIAVVCAMLALALTGGAIGALSRPALGPAAASVHTGPFSYFPSE